jgi:hypothetical protein
MNQKETQIILTRIEKWYARIQTQFISDTKILDAEFGWSKDSTPVPFLKNGPEKML